MTIALITSIYGDYDELVDPPEQDGVDEYIAVVDRHYAGCQRWMQIVEPRSHLHPRMAAKVAKCRPDLYTNAETTVWIDGGARLLHGGVAQWAASHGPYAQFVHPERDDISAEAEVSAGMEKYANQPVLDQAAHYKKQGLPDGFGLWATGMLVLPRKWDLLGDEWLTQQLRWSYQDQISLPFVLWQMDMKPNPLLDNLWGNRHVQFTGHRSSA
jgi:hypothetical protein